MKLLIFIAAAVLFLAAALLNKAYRAIPLHELRRRARAGRSKSDAAIFKAAAYGESLEILLWLIGSLSASALILMAANFGWWLAVLFVLLGFFFIFAGPRSLVLSPWQWRLAALAARPAASVLSSLQPVLHYPGKFLKNKRPQYPHTQLYEKEDLLELLKRQALQSDNHFSDLELAIVRGALSFGDKSAGQLMTPRSKLKMVAAGDRIGPLLMDELHKTDQRRFLVVKEITKSTAPQVLGSLYIDDLLNHLDEKGTIRDIMHPGAAYINEEQSLRQALEAFLKTHQHLLAVVNNFEEVSGSLSIEAVIEQILGEKITDEFDGYNQPDPVAGPSSDDKNHNEVDVAPEPK